MASNDRNESFDKLNGVRYAEPGNVQSVIDDAISDPDIGMGFDKAKVIVSLISGTAYELGSENGSIAAIDLKPGVLFRGNGAILRNTNDAYDGHFLSLDNGCAISGHLRCGVDTNALSTGNDIIHIDTDTAQEGKYSIGAAGSPVDTHAHMRDGFVEILGDPGVSASNMGGNGIAFRGSSAVTIGSNFDMTIFRMENGIYNDNRSFANMDTSFATTIGCINHVRNSSNAQPFQTPLVGVHQPTGPTERFTYNQSNANMPVFQGEVWDPANAPTNALVGDTQIQQWLRTSFDWTPNSDGTASQAIFEYGPGQFGQGAWRFNHPSEDVEYAIESTNNKLSLDEKISGNRIADFYTGGAIQVSGTGNASFPAYRLANGGGLYEATDGDPEVSDDGGNSSSGLGGL